MVDKTQKYIIISVCLHIAVLFIFIFNLSMISRTPVLVNTNKQEVISAVVLGDLPQSKILPKETIAESQPQVKAPLLPPKAPPKKVETLPVKKDEIALKVVDKKHELLADDLLADIEKQTQKQKKLAKKIKQQQLQAKFEKMLRQQAEKSLRQELLNDEIKLKGMQSRQSQGEINQYKALVLQAISEQWIVPTQSNKKLYCELLIRLSAGGLVLDVQVTKSSGDLALDNSARAAVLKASPLPVPNKPEEFAAFRQFILKVKPENIIASSNTML